jgi:hypothetical protein
MYEIVCRSAFLVLPGELRDQLTTRETTEKHAWPKAFSSIMWTKKGNHIPRQMESTTTLSRASCAARLCTKWPFMLSSPSEMQMMRSLALGNFRWNSSSESFAKARPGSRLAYTSANLGHRRLSRRNMYPLNVLRPHVYLLLQSAVSPSAVASFN